MNNIQTFNNYGIDGNDILCLVAKLRGGAKTPMKKLSQKRVVYINDINNSITYYNSNLNEVKPPILKKGNIKPTA